MLQVRSDRRDAPALRPVWRQPGRSRRRTTSIPMAERSCCPSKLTHDDPQGDVFRHVLAGGGGWGDPLERDPAAVLRDVRNELLSPRRRAADYGVIVDTDGLARRRGGDRSAARGDAPARGWRERAQGAAARSRCRLPGGRVAP